MSRLVTRPLLLVAGLAAVGLFALQIRGVSANQAPTAAPATLVNAGATATRVVAEGRLTTYPGAEVLVGSEVAGTIVSLPVAEKQRLRKGELVALLRADDLAAQLAEARARVVECEAEIRLAEAERDRAESLYAQKVDTASRRDKAVRDLEVSNARRTNR